MSDLSMLLKVYGYETLQEQLDIICLIYLSGAFHPARLIKDLQIAGCNDAEITHAEKVILEATQGRQYSPPSIEHFKPALILSNLFYRASENFMWPENLHHWLLCVTQREFFARRYGQERWEQKAGQWLEVYSNEVNIIIERLGLEKEVPPTHKFYKAVCPLGSTAPEIENRIKYTEHILKTYDITTPMFYFLTGERYINVIADGDDYIEKVGHTYNISKEEMMETHLMQYAIDEARKNNNLFSKIPYEIIHSPRRGKIRPTTIDSVIDLAKIVPTLEGDVLFVSGAPNIDAQREDILITAKKYLPKIRSETVGDKCEDIPINQVISALGGALFGGYPRVAIEMGCQETIGSLLAKRAHYSYRIKQQI